jgi:hypothetical protein
VAVLLAVRVRVLELDAGLALHEPVTPLGKPETASVTLPVNPLTGVTRIVSVAVEPATIVIWESADERVKLPFEAVVTVTAIEVVAMMLPEVPVMVMSLVAAAAVLATVRVSTLVLVVGLGENAAVTPAGRPLAESVMLPAKQPTSPTVIVSVPLLPCAIDRADAEGESVRLCAAAVTVRAMVVVAVNVPDVPVMVTAEVPGTAVLLAVKVSTLVAVVGLVP